ncbi:unnamed protein product [Somion occarium]|uniref:Uncharacterized protein n=1 Tax=Somion occarium TaxID=3059160 RepID=A0ABP1DL92_9APHY
MKRRASLCARNERSGTESRILGIFSYISSLFIFVRTLSVCLRAQRGQTYRLAFLPRDVYFNTTCFPQMTMNIQRFQFKFPTQHLVKVFQPLDVSTRLWRSVTFLCLLNIQILSSHSRDHIPASIGLYYSPLHSISRIQSIVFQGDLLKVLDLAARSLGNLVHYWSLGSGGTCMDHSLQTKFDSNWAERTSIIFRWRKDKQFCFSSGIGIIALCIARSYRGRLFVR